MDDISLKVELGRILAYRDLGGYSVQSGGKHFGAKGDPRAEALNIYCLNELVAHGLTERQSESMFVLTEDGFDFEAPSELLQAPALNFPTLSAKNIDTVKEIMQAAVAGDGTIISTAYLSGAVFHAGNKSVDSRGDLRTEGHWKSVLKELVASGLIVRISEEIYLVSHVGFLWTDELNQREDQTDV